MRLLVVDDNPYVRRLYETRARQRADVQVECADTIERALAFIRSALLPYDLIVCDEHLGRRTPDADGVALVQRLSELDLPVALITDGIASASGLGPNVRVLMRPVGLDELIAVSQTLGPW